MELLKLNLRKVQIAEEEMETVISTGTYMPVSDPTALTEVFHC